MQKSSPIYSDVISVDLLQFRNISLRAAFPVAPYTEESVDQGRSPRTQISSIRSSPKKLGDDFHWLLLYLP